MIQFAKHYPTVCFDSVSLDKWNTNNLCIQVKYRNYLHVMKTPQVWFLFLLSFSCKDDQYPLCSILSSKSHLARVARWLSDFFYPIQSENIFTQPFPIMSTPLKHYFSLYPSNNIAQCCSEAILFCKMSSVILCIR